jgi:hypothetical protein
LNYQLRDKSAESSIVEQKRRAIKSNHAMLEEENNIWLRRDANQGQFITPNSPQYYPYDIVSTPE